MENLLNPGITIGAFTIYYYAIIIVCGILVATCLSALLMKRRNMSPDFIFTLFIFCIPSALICARLYYCITDGMNISQWFAWDSLRRGGLSIIGGVIGGVGMGVVVCLVKKVNFFRAADCVVVTILIAQAIGRWGNFANQEVYGTQILDPSQQWFPWGVEIDGKWYHALFFYESFINLIGFGILYSAAWFWTKKPNGVFTFAYFIWYGTVRAFMEPLRDPQYILGNGTDHMWSQLTSILLIVMGFVGVAVLIVLNYRKEGAFFGSKQGDPCGITAYLSPDKDEQPYFSKINILGANYPPKPEKEKKGDFLDPQLSQEETHEENSFEEQTVDRLENEPSAGETSSDEPDGDREEESGE